MPLDNSEHRGARGGDGSGEDEADGVSHHFEDDDPPGVGHFHARFLGFLRILENPLDLFFRNFDFHVGYGLKGLTVQYV